jgi:xylulokinase
MIHRQETKEGNVFILTIDIGLTNCKVSLFDFHGKLNRQATQRYPTITVKTDWSEQDPGDWWQAIKTSVRDLSNRPGVNVSEIDVIAVTAHMHGMIAVDGEGRPLTHCWTLFDRRAVSEAQEIAQKIGERTAYDLTGGRLEAYTPAAKILWLKNHHPEIFKRTAFFLSPKDVVRVLLGGELATDPIDAVGMLLYDIKSQVWAQEILDAIGLPPEKLPEVRASSSSGGFLSSEAAKELGLKEGVPLIVGAGDDIEALGAGVIHPSQTLEHIGTTGTMITCLDHLIFDEDQAVEVYPHGLPNRYLLGGATNAAGRSLDWAMSLFSFEEAGEEFLPIQHPPRAGTPDPPIYLPFISGERGLLWESHATGGFLGLREGHTPVDLALGVYQGVAFSMKEFLVAAERLGARPNSILSGTPSKPRDWSQLRADIYGLPISFLETPYPTGLGAAMLAYEYLNVFSSLAEAAERCCHVSEQVHPDPEWREHFDKKFETYETTVQTCKALFSKIM